MTVTEFLLARVTEKELDAHRYPDLAIAEHEIAECDRDRRVLELADMSMGKGAEMAYDNVLRLMAKVYADHPDYRDEWKP